MNTLMDAPYATFHLGLRFFRIQNEKRSMIIFSLNYLDKNSHMFTITLIFLSSSVQI